MLKINQVKNAFVEDMSYRWFFLLLMYSKFVSPDS